MSLFGGFKLFTQDVAAPDWWQRVTSTFGYLDAEEQSKDRGVALSDKNKLVPSHGENGDMIGAQFYGNMRRYINYEEPTKPMKLRVYRQMSGYPEVKYALSLITHELMNYSDLDGNVGELRIKNESILENQNKTDNIKKEWKYVFDELLDFKDTGYDAILSFLISGELIFEKVSNPFKPEEGLKRVKRLRPDNIYPIWKVDLDGIEKFKIKDIRNISFEGEIPKSKLAYAYWDSWLQNAETGEIYVVSYLEPIKKTWRQLMLLEEALIIYRVVRAPERRIFKIATGNMPPKQAEAHVKKIMRLYRQKKIYNTSTGEIDGQNNILAMLEDFFLPQPADGNTTEIDTLPGGENLGEITDINYFLEKLYRALDIPMNRRLEHYSGDQKYNIGNVTDISWQEMKFEKMVNRIRRKVVAVIWDIFKTHLKMKGLWDQYNLKDTDLEVVLNQNNFFEEMKRAQLEEVRLNAWGTVSTYVGDVFSKEMAVKHFLKWTNEQWKLNKDLLAKEKSEGDEEIEGGGGGGPTI